MQVLKEAGPYTIYKKRSGRYAVKSKDGRYVNGLEKLKILIEAGIVKSKLPSEKPKDPAPAEAAEPAAEASDHEAAQEETPASEEAPKEQEAAVE